MRGMDGIARTRETTAAGLASARNVDFFQTGNELESAAGIGPVGGRSISSVRPPFPKLH